MGAGIAGAALAAALTGQGLSVALLERRTGPLDTARGDHIQPALLPVLKRWGVLDSMLADGAEWRQGTRWFNHEGQHVVTVPAIQTDDLPNGFLFLNHERIGNVLLQRAVEGGSHYFPELERWHLERRDNCWRLLMEQSGSRQFLDCTLLVGADGTASRVRTELGLGLERHSYKHPIAILYGRQRHGSGPRTLDVHLTRDRILSLIPRTGGLTKIGFPVDHSELPLWRDQPAATLARQLEAWCPGLEFEQLEFGSIYPPLSQRASAYNGPGQALLIGDASHAMHPARSMGMNTCFRIADQLAGQLAGFDSGFSDRDIAPLIADFETETQRTLTPLLAENHAAGLQMDTLSGNGFPALVDQLRAAAGNEQVSQAMATKASGWPL